MKNFFTDHTAYRSMPRAVTVSAGQTSLLTHASRPKRAGIALVVVMMMIGVIGILAVTLMRVTISDQVRTATDQNRRITRSAAVGAAHRGVTMLRRTPTLRGSVSAPGPEGSLGVTTTITVTPDLAGQLIVTATANYRGAVASEQISVDPTRL